MKIVKVIGAVFLVLLAIVAVAVAAGGYWLQTEAGRRWLTATLEQAASGPGQQLELGGLDGSPFGTLVARDVVLSDEQGVWLSVDRAGLTWRPLELLSGTVRISALDVGRVDLRRLPAGEEPAEEEEEPAGSPGLPELPVTVALDGLSVERLNLGEPVLGGEAAAVRIAGSAFLGDAGRRLSATLDVDRVDGREGSVRLRAAVVPDENRLDLAASIDEPQGGLVARLAGLPGLPPVEASLQGEGTLADWRGRLVAAAGEALGVNADITVGRVEEGGLAAHRVSVEARGDVAALLPETARPLAGPRPTLHVSLLVPEAGPLRIEPVRLEAAAGTVEATGTYALDVGALDLEIRAEVAADSPLAELAGASWRALALDARVQGTTAAPRLDAALTADGLAVAGVEAGSVGIEARLAPAEDAEGLGDGQTGDGQTPALAFTVDGRVEGLAGLEPDVADAAGAGVTLAAAGLVAPDAGRVRLDRLALDTAAGTLDGTAALEGWGERVQARLDLDLPELARFADLAGMPLQGAATAGTDIVRGEDGVLRVDVAGAGRDLVTGIRPADALLGGTLMLEANATLAGDGALRVEGIDIAGRRVAVTADARVADGRVEAALTAELPELAPVGETLGTGLAGGMTLNATVEGATDAPTARLQVTGRDLAVAGRTLDATGLMLTAEDPAGDLRGRIEAATRVDGVPLELASDYALGDGVLALDGVGLATAGGRIGGDLRVDLAGPAVTGRLDGTLPELGTLSPLAGRGLAGSVTLSAELAAPEGRQSATLSAQAEGLRVDGEDGPVLAARTLGLDADLTDLLGTPAGRLALDGGGVAAGDAEIATLSAGLEGSLDSAQYELAATGAAGGAAGQRFEVASAGALEQDGTVRRLRIAELSGSYGEEPFRLAGPALLSSGPEGIAVEDLVLRSGDAGLTASLRLGEDAFGGEVRLERVPLGLARLVDPTLDLGGTLSGEAVLAGTPAAPRADGELRVSGARAVQASQAGIEGVDATLTARWRDGEVAVDAAARTEQEGVDLRLAATMPLGLDPETLVPQVPDPAPLNADIDGRVDLARFNDLLAARGDRVAGRLEVDLTASGTLGEPLLGGTAVLADGRYESRATGTVVTDIRARLVGSGTRLTVQEFAGNTPGGGTLAAEGAVDLDPEAPRQLDLRVIARNARLLQTDLATAVIGGDLTLEGTMERAELAGDVRIRRAEIRVPSSLPPSIVELDVTEVNAGVTGVNAGVTEVNAGVTEVNGRAPEGQAAEARPPGAPPVPRRKPVPPGAAERPEAAEPGAPVEPGMVIALDMTVVAENQIFVRGRGLDAELGGELAIAGTADDPRIEGDLELIKGELNLLSQQFVFSRGMISFPGDGSLMPTLDLVAETDAGDVTARIAVTGRVTEPQIALSSEPELPQDEVLARVLFGTATADLTALQAVQLAQSAASLAGFGGGPGILDQVRQAVGVDRLEITGGEGDGPGAVAAGRYLSEDVYVGVEQDVEGGGTRARVELDVTDNVQVEADVGGRKGGRVGVQFEWEY